MNFPYMHEEHYNADIDIEDLGNCYLNALNDLGEEWYLAIDTELGWTTIRQFGPLMVDLDDLPVNFSFTHTKIEYDSKKLFKIINEFLNNKYRGVSQAIEVDKQFVSDRFDGLKLKI